MRLAITFALCVGCSFTPGGTPTTDGSNSQAVPHKALEVVAGAGRAKVGTITIDVQVGHGVLPRKSTAGTITISGAPAVKP